jgi:hypothetical protein
MGLRIREIRLGARRHRIFVTEHPEGGVRLFSPEFPQAPIWSSSEEEGLRLMEKVLKRLGRGEDVADMVLPGGPMNRSPG